MCGGPFDKLRVGAKLIIKGVEMSNTSLYIGKDFWSSLTAREPYVRRQKRLFERGVISEITEDVVAVCVGRREDGSEILLEEVPVVSGYNPQVGDWVVIRYDAGHGGAPMVFGPSVSDGSEEDPSTSSAEVVAARSSARYGAHASLDARLEEHEQDGTDPHGAALTQTSKVRTPLVDAAGNLNLVPGAGYQVTVGDTGSGGVFRPVVIADQAYQTRAMQEVLLVAAAPAITADAWLGNLAFYPVNTDHTKAIVGLVSQLTFTGTNLAKASSSGAFAAQLTLNGSGAFPAASSHPTPVMDCNAVLGASFSGSIAALAGITPHLIYAAGGTGTVTDYYGVYLRGDVAVASKVTNFTGLYLPAAPSNITNYYPIQIGGGTILGNGAVTWAAASDLVPLAIQGASGQTADLLRLQDNSANVLARFDAAGKLGIGCVPTYAIDIAGSSGIYARITSAYAGQYGPAYILQGARGTPGSPTASQSGDVLGGFTFNGYGTSQWLTGALIRAVTQETWTNSAAGTKLQFYLTAIGAASGALKADLVPATGLVVRDMASASNYIYINHDGSNAVIGRAGAGGIQVGGASDNIGFFGQTPAARPAHIADPSGGKVIDTEARAAIVSLNAMCATLGLTAA